MRRSSSSRLKPKFSVCPMAPVMETDSVAASPPMAAAGMAAGAVTVILWSQVHQYFWDLYEMLPGFAAGLLAVVGVSLLDRPPSRAIREEFARAIGQSRGPTGREARTRASAAG